MAGIGALLGGVSALSSMVGGVVAYGQHRKYANLLGQQNKTMPAGILQAESIYREQANTGMYGKDMYETSVKNMMPLYLSQAKRSADSPGALLGALTQAWTKTGDQMMTLNMKDSAMRQQGQQNLATFLSGTKATQEAAIEEWRINRDLAVQRERMMGTKELMAGITGGIGQGIQTFGDLTTTEGNNMWADWLSGQLSGADKTDSEK